MELLSEPERFSEGQIPHDLPAFTAEEIALRALIDLMEKEETTA